MQGWASLTFTGLGPTQSSLSNLRPNATATFDWKTRPRIETTSHPVVIYPHTSPHNVRVSLCFSRKHGDETESTWPQLIAKWKWSRNRPDRDCERRWEKMPIAKWFCSPVTWVCGFGLKSGKKREITRSLRCKRRKCQNVLIMRPTCEILARQYICTVTSQCRMSTFLLYNQESDIVKTCLKKQSTPRLTAYRIIE